MPLKIPENFQNILVTGGGGFIGGALIRRLIKETELKIYNLDKVSYATDFTSIKNLIDKEGDLASERYTFLKVDLSDFQATKDAVFFSKPDLIIHLAAESHVDRSIDSPLSFIQSNIFGTFNLLESSRNYLDTLNLDKKDNFRFHHVSTDEVFGSLGNEGLFREDFPYSPRSPYSASKASSDHLVNAWHHTYGIPTIITNCSNNFGPWQYIEKLIPTVIFKALNKEKIPIYGDGSNIRDWLFVEDHVDALLLAAIKGKSGSNYCIGGNSEMKNIDLVKNICSIMDNISQNSYKHSDLITFVKDRPGHDARYGIDSSKISKELNWEPKYSFEKALDITVRWYLNNINWCKSLIKSSPRSILRKGLIN